MVIHKKAREVNGRILSDFIRSINFGDRKIGNRPAGDDVR
jgi:hypothetical protein